MAPKYKVIYFNVRALGEPIRYILSQAGEEFEDVRVEFEKWPLQKNDTPFGKMPILEVNGKRTHQSASICRFLGRELGLAGVNNWENQQIDCTVDTVVDLRIAIVNVTYGDRDLPSEMKEERKKKLFEETVPFYLTRLDEQVKNNGGYFVNNKLTWADLHFAAMIEFFNASLETSDCIAAFPNLKALVEKVNNLPKIKAWREKRPETPF